MTVLLDVVTVRNYCGVIHLFDPLNFIVVVVVGIASFQKSMYGGGYFSRSKKKKIHRYCRIVVAVAHSLGNCE